MDPYPDNGAIIARANEIAAELGGRASPSPHESEVRNGQADPRLQTIAKTLNDCIRYANIPKEELGQVSILPYEPAPVSVPA